MAATLSTSAPRPAGHPSARTPGAETWIAPLDAARSAVLRVVGRPARRLLADRDARVALYGSFGIVSAFAMATLAPLWLLALGPIVLGVPHLLADARYMVVRQGLHRRAGFWALVVLPLVLTFIHPQATTAFVAVLGATMLARGRQGDGTGGVWSTPGSYLRRSIVLAPALGVTVICVRGGHTGDVVMAHMHNLAALAIWWAWAPRRTGGLRWVPLALFAAGGALLLGGALDGAYLASRGPGISLHEMVRTLSCVQDPRVGLRLVLFFAFAQSIHYAVWLRLVPEEDRPRPGLRSFQSSLRALVGDLGWLPVIACALGVVGLTGWALLDPHAARLAYLRMALFHGPLELAVVAILFIERRPLKTA